MTTRKRVLWYGLLVAGGLTLILTWPQLTQRSRPAPTVAASATEEPRGVITLDEKQLPQIAVDTIKESRVAVDRNATGRIGFNEDRLTPVFTPYAGRVVELLANKGDQVKTGQPLMVIESPDFVTAQNDLASARSDVAKAEIGNKEAQTILDRARALYSQEAIAAKEVQQAEADLARAKDEVRRAGMALSTVKHRLSLFGKEPDEISSLEGHVDRQVVLRAPIGGTIVDRKVGPGQYVKPDVPDPLFMISDLSTLWANADIYENDSASVHLNMPVQVHVAAYPDQQFPAKISFISPTVDPATRTLRVRCLVPNSTGLLKPDMFATVTIGAAIEQNVPIVPATAVVIEGNTSLVFVSDGPRQFQKRTITVGREMNGGFAVDSGLQVGEVVATRGGLLLNELSKANQ